MYNTFEVRDECKNDNGSVYFNFKKEYFDVLILGLYCYWDVLPFTEPVHGLTFTHYTQFYMRCLLCLALGLV